MSTTIPDFSEAEQRLVSTQLFKRYGKLIPVQLADSELQLGHDPEQLTACPTIYWSERGAHFVICKVAADRYRCQFFYSDSDQYGTGHDEYDDLENCVVTLLQVQADHERQLSNVSSAATAANLSDDDYHGPSVI
ncbi:MAG: hypothetical protein WA435_06780 [Gallionellaceae bacterium]